MSMKNSNAFIRSTAIGIAIARSSAVLAGCETYAGKGAAEGAGTGAKGRQSKNPNYALAGLWLEILSYADQGQESKARDLFPTLVEQDWNIDSTAQAETKMREGTTALGNIREEYGRPRVCVT